MKFRSETVYNTSLIHLWVQREKVLSIAPDYGAKLLHLKLLQEGRWFPVLWEVEFSELKNNVFGKNDVLFPFPNRTDRGIFEFQNRDYRFPLNEPENNNAIHGFLRNEAFRVSSTNVEPDGAEISLIHESKGKPYFPFPFHFMVRYKWKLDGFFEVNFSVMNTGEGPFPFGLGWHPYFDVRTSRLEDVTVYLPELKEFSLNERFLPTGGTKVIKKQRWRPQNRFFNATYQVLSTPKSYMIEADKLTVRITTSENLSFLQLYTPPDEGVLALEPMSCCVNALNNHIGLKTLKAGECFKSKVAIAIRGIQE